MIHKATKLKECPWLGFLSLLLVDLCSFRSITFLFDFQGDFGTILCYCYFFVLLVTQEKAETTAILEGTSHLQQGAFVCITRVHYYFT